MNSVENEELGLVRTETDAVAAELLRGTLDGEGIPSVVRERNAAGAAIGLYTGLPTALYDVYVRTEDAETARSLLQERESERGEVTDEELIAAADESYDERV